MTLTQRLYGNLGLPLQLPSQVSGNAKESCPSIVQMKTLGTTVIYVHGEFCVQFYTQVAV